MDPEHLMLTTLQVYSDVDTAVATTLLDCARLTVQTLFWTSKDGEYVQ